MREKQWIAKRMFYRVMWPSFISALALAIADTADALAVGSRLGEKGLAAIGIVTPIYMLYNMIGYGFSTGGCVTHGKLTATGQNEAAQFHFKHLSGCILLLGAVIAAGGNIWMRPLMGLLGVNDSRPELLALCEAYARPLIGACPIFMINFILYDFVRVDDDPGLATLGFSLGCGVDLGLNILLVIVLNMGITGSIIATVSAQTVSVAVLAVHLFNERGVLQMRDILRSRGEKAENRKRILESLGTGFSSSFRYIFQFVFLFTANRLLLRAGDRGLVDGDLYVAVFDVVMNVSYIALALYEASAETMQPLASAFSEEHDKKSLDCVLRLAMKWGLASGTLIAALLAVFASPVSSFFGLEESAFAVSDPAIRIFCLSTPFAGFLIVLTAYYQSCGREKMSGVITALRNAVFLLGFTFLFGMLWPEHFWGMFTACEITSTIACLAVNRISRSRGQEDDAPVFSAAMDNENHELPLLLSGLEAFCEEHEIPLKKATQIQLTVEELCLVTMEQAFTGQPDEYIQVTVAQEANGDFTLHIRNSAPRFNPFDMEMGRIQRDAKKELLDSVGVLLVKKQSKEMHYRNYEGFNVLMVVI